MATKLYDITIKVGEYPTKDGPKASYETIGGIFENEKGKYLKLKASCLSMQLNFIANKEQKDFVFGSLFKASNNNKAKAVSNAPQAAIEEFNDDIPF